MVPVRTTSLGGRVADGPGAHEHDMRLGAAARLHAEGDSAGALEILPDLVAARPDHLDTRLLMARCLVVVGAPAVARAAAEAAVDVDPSSWQAHVLVARAVMATDPPTAVAAAERAVALAPAEPEPHKVLAEATGARGDSPTDALLDPARPDPLDRARGLAPILPQALRGVAPEGAPESPVAPATPAPPATRAPVVAPTTVAPPLGLLAEETAEPRERREPVLPKALGGTGLGGPDADSPTEGRDEVGTPRLVFRIIGLVGWVLLGFRFGVQVIGGPLGLLLFAAIVAGVAVGARRVANA